MAASTDIIEIFSSIQGEGPYVGEPQVFVRFQDCALSCTFCDSPLSFVQNKYCRVEFPPFSKKFEKIPNPISIEQINAVLARFQEKTLSVTGGEPLQKASFLKEWLPTIRPRFKVLLETAGVHPQELQEVIQWIDIVSMDLKLPSSTGMKAWWTEHEAFLKIAAQKDVYVKLVVTSETTPEDIERAMSLVGNIDPAIPFILQPASPFAKFTQVPSLEKMAAISTRAAASLKHVRVIPQVHKQMGVL